MFSLPTGTIYKHLSDGSKVSEYKKYLEDLINWCWLNLQFNNCPESWEDTFIIDIVKGYQGNCHTHDGKAYSYKEIRKMFRGDN